MDAEIIVPELAGVSIRRLLPKKEHYAKIVFPNWQGSVLDDLCQKGNITQC